MKALSDFPIHYYDKPDIIVKGDFHLKEKIWKNRPQIEGDTYASFEYTCKLADKLDTGLFLLGDNFDDKRPSSKSLSFVRECYHKYCHSPSDPKFYGIDGNHDEAIPSWLNVAVGSCPHADQPFILKTPDRHIFCCPYRHRDEIERIVKSIPLACDTFMGHQLLDIAFRLAESFNLKAEWFPDHVKHIILGDYHVCSDWKYGDKTFTYTGSSALLNTGEEQKKYVLKYDLKTMTYEKIRIPTRPFLFTPFIDSSEAVDKVLDPLTVAELGEMVTQEYVELAREGIDPKTDSRYDAVLFVDYDPAAVDGAFLSAVGSTYSKHFSEHLIFFRPRRIAVNVEENLVKAAGEMGQIDYPAVVRDLMGGDTESRPYKQALALLTEQPDIEQFIESWKADIREQIAIREPSA